MSAGVVWFRSDLRLDDNPAWNDATQRHSDVVALYVMDETLIASAGARRREVHGGFVAALDEALGGRLCVRRGNPTEVVPDVVAEVGADALYLNGDVTRYAQRRDGAVTAEMERRSVDTTVHWGTVVHAPGSVLASTGRVSRVFTPFYRRWMAADRTPWPGPGDASVASLAGEDLHVADAVRRRFDEAAVDRRVGIAIERSHDYRETHDLPAASGTSELSTDLAFGAVSPRGLIDALGDGPGPTGLVRQLGWRDWYHHLFFEMPELAIENMSTKRAPIVWRDAPEDLERWIEGTTGFPFVDAGMRQLAQTGWMHNRVRMVTASFLVKDLLIDWRLGERYFRRVLVDADVPQNAGNWQWVAGTGPDAAPFFRILNPTTQSRRFDSAGEYIRRWVPELANLDARHIHEPAAAGPLDLAAAGIQMGAGYPFPMVDHADARSRALDAYGL